MSSQTNPLWPPQRAKPPPAAESRNAVIMQAPALPWEQAVNKPGIQWDSSPILTRGNAQGTRAVGVTACYQLLNSPSTLIATNSATDSNQLSADKAQIECICAKSGPDMIHSYSSSKYGGRCYMR